jgi:hypothetical protein
MGDVVAKEEDRLPWTFFCTLAGAEFLARKTAELTSNSLEQIDARSRKALELAAKYISGELKEPDRLARPATVISGDSDDSDDDSGDESEGEPQSS